MAKPKVYDAPIPATNSSVQHGNGNAKNSNKSKARYPNTPKMPNQSTGVKAGGYSRALTPGTTPTGS